MSDSAPPSSRKDADLSTALALTEQFLAPRAEDGADPADSAPSSGVGKNMRYWMWRMGGRKRPDIQDTSHIARLFDNYEIELDRQKKAHQAELDRLHGRHQAALEQARRGNGDDIDRIRAEIQAEADRSLLEARRELAHARERTSKLEQLTNQLQQAYDAELAKARNAAAAISDGPLRQALDRVEELERRMGSLRADQDRALEAAHAAHAAALEQAAESSARAIAEIRTEAARNQAAAETLVADLSAETARKLADAEIQLTERDLRIVGMTAAHAAELERLRQDMGAESEAAVTATSAALDAALHESRDKLTEAARQRAHLLARMDELVESQARALAALGEAKDREMAAILAEMQAAAEAETRKAEQDRNALLADLERAEAAAARRQAALEAELEAVRQAHLDELRLQAGRHADELDQQRRQAAAARDETERRTHERTAARQAEHEQARDEAARLRSVLESRIGQLLETHAREQREQTDRHSAELTALREDMAAQARAMLQQALDRVAELESARETTAAWHAAEIEKNRAALAASGDANLRHALEQLTGIQAERRQWEARTKEERDAHLRELGILADRHAAELTRERRAVEEEFRPHLQRALDRITELERQMEAPQERQAEAVKAALEAGQEQSRAALLAAKARTVSLQHQLAEAQDEIRAAEERLQTALADQRHDLQAAHDRILREGLAQAAETAESQLAQRDGRIAELEAGAEAETRAHAAALERMRREMTAEFDAVQESAAADRADEVARLTARIAEARHEGLSEAEDGLHAAQAGEIAALTERHAQAAAAAEARIAALADELARQRDAHAAEIASLQNRPSIAAAADGARLSDSHRQEIERLQREADRQRGELDYRLIAATDRIADLEADLARLRLSHGREQERLIAEHADAVERLRQGLDRADRADIARQERDLAEARDRIADLEAQLASQSGHRPAIDADTRLNAALARAMMAEDDLRIANNKLELLKDALEAAKARAVLPGPGAADNRFRDAKRSFARHFHPDQGGKGDIGKQRIFLEFWPVLDKIERNHES